MTLCKYICEMCVNEWARRNNDWFCWTDEDEKRWVREGYVFCPHDRRPKARDGGAWYALDIGGGVPEHCLYKVEQFVSMVSDESTGEKHEQTECVGRRRDV